MESAPVIELPRGSIVEVIQSKIAPEQLGLLSRRVLVRRIIPQGQCQPVNNEVVQGWASIQSWQGYVILSPLSSLCYTNTRWGSTRPIIRQCGHAAHLRCVEAHCLSLHQRAAGNQPYDGRFSANIEDGEFLCPLCKQLSNILIPEDKPVDADGMQAQAATAASMREGKDGFEVVKSPADITLIRNILVRKAPVSYSEASSKSDKATQQFGSSLSQAMQLSSNDYNLQRRREKEFWHPALRRWDFEDDDQGGFNGPKTPQIGSILRLMRQQLISWAAIGHSAAAAEACGRGTRQEMFGEVSYISKDPWSDFKSKDRDSHPRLLELRRTMAAAASLFDGVTFELGKQLGTLEEKNRGESVPILGSLISDILEGQNWMVDTMQSSSSTDDEWRVVTSLIASIMCHVSKEDTIASRLEARNVAASMWAITGSSPPPSASDSSMAMNLDSSQDAEVEVSAVGNNNQNDGALSDDPANDVGSNEPRPVLPPTPLSIYRAERNLSVELGNKWGTLDPFKVKSNTTAFRPAVASAFLYVPLLAWDLNVLAGAVFSSLLSNAKSNPCVSLHELLQSAKVLLVGRLVQVLSTPGGFLTKTNTQTADSFDDFDEDQFWDDAKTKTEATAVKELLSFCRKTLSGNNLDQGPQGLDDATLLKNVGNAILPFARTLILLLRSSSSAVRQRHRNGSTEETKADKAVAKMTEDSNIMTIEDGFRLLSVIGAPLPSSILKADSSHSSWISLVTRWLTALSGFETYNGTRGNGLAFDNDSQAWKPVTSNNTNSSPLGAQALNLQVDTSGSAVEVAQLAQQGVEEQPQGDGNDDADIDLEVESSDESSTDEAMEIVDEAIAADSEEELEDVDDMDVEFEDDSSDEPFGDFGNPFDHLISQPLSVQHEFDLDVDDASDVNASLAEPDGSKIPGPNDRMFSYVSRSAIVPYQPSILGLKVGPGPRGARGDLFEYQVANSVMKDLSHLGSIHLPGEALSCFVKLPQHFVELYSMVNRVKGRDSRTDTDDDDERFETAICLLTGAVMCAGTAKRAKSNRPPGTCTLHARKVGSGIGIFFLVQKCTILLMHNNKSAYSPSLYVDEHGEEDVGLKRGRPLFFSEERYQALETLWRTHGIPREVSQIRSTSDRVIRDNWY